MPFQSKKIGLGNGRITLPETNIAPENGWLEDYFPFGKAYFQVRLLLVSGRVWPLLGRMVVSNPFIGPYFLGGWGGYS